ncbi:DgyrCDS14964 [Dimorphilus gyrociliatus]|uniref:DgyrCDS14964 n=1 Tax=Dimorphilus gyrociliatus TaxID=2664684 RepID=A0A7I8WFH0_9ANNE|nr:DgyrCDS14964 [Dimorphilus gyrociliatus]
MINSSIRISLLLIFCNVYSNAKFPKLINIADFSWNSTCSADHFRPTIAGFSFKPDHLMYPHWINMFSWLNYCTSDCNTAKVTITFQKLYNISDYCLSQAFMTTKYRTENVKVIFNTNKYSIVKLEEFKKNIECFLPQNNYGINVEKMSFITGKSTYGDSAGFSSIMIFTFLDVAEDINHSEFYTDIASSNNGATCSVKSVFNAYQCKYALDLVSGLSISSQEWSSQCHINNNNCAGQYFKVTFTIFDVPVIYCFANRQTTHKNIKKLKLKWSSGVEEFASLKNNKFQKCFKYTNMFIETDLYVEVVEIYTIQNVGLSILQVFVKGPPFKDYVLQGTQLHQYTIPPYIQNNFKAIAFSLFGHRSSEDNNCGDILLVFSHNDRMTFEVFLSNLNQSYILTFSQEGDVYEKDAIREYITCDEWNDFWITATNDAIRLGRGLMYNKETLITTHQPSQINGLSKKIELRNVISHHNHTLKINDLGK